jgi:hypothetical protein
MVVMMEERDGEARARWRHVLNRKGMGLVERDEGKRWRK